MYYNDTSAINIQLPYLLGIINI